MEDIVVHVIVATAVLFLARWVYRNLFVKTNEPGCNSCERCVTEIPPASDASEAAPSRAIATKQ